MTLFPSRGPWGGLTVGSNRHLEERQVNWLLSQWGGESLPELGLLSEGELWLSAHSAPWRFNSRIGSSRGKTQAEVQTGV